MNNIEKGKFGEYIAIKYLSDKGYSILEQNYRNAFGEIDIICRKFDYLIFIEVKSRTSITFGYPYEAVDWRKKNNILKTSLIYIGENNISDLQFRYDIIEIYLKSKKINHIKNAF